MSKQSSIEWLNRWFIDNQEATHEEGHAALKKAKAMHQEEVELFGALCCVKTAQKNEWSLEKLYNETFGDEEVL